MGNFEARRKRLRQSIRRTGADALLVTNFTNVTYLAGFTGDDSYLYVDRHKTVIISDPRYTTQLEEEAPDVEIQIRPAGTEMIAAVARVVKSSKARRLAIEGTSMTVALHERLSAALEKVEVVSSDGLVEELREIKDAEEIAKLREAAHYAERGFAVLRATLRPDRTELDVAYDLEHQMRLMGASGCSFPPIIAVGARAALPHARPTSQTIGAAPFVLVDWGATAQLYRSDLTRVLVTGKISSKLESVYGVVLSAQKRAIEAIRPGVTGKEVDAVARAFINKSKYAKRFGHGLGHGIGLDIHEGPRLSVTNSRPLEPGMVVTVEPGIYLPGWGGVRIEDDVLVTKDGHEVLTDVPKEFEQAVV